MGPNGSGKSTLLKALGNREVPIPEHIDIYFLDREIPASDMTALEVLPCSPAPHCPSNCGADRPAYPGLYSSLMQLIVYFCDISVGITPGR